MEIISNIEKHIYNEKDHNPFFKAYSFTNENIGSYIPYFDLKDKSLLTVGSSSDQAINASLAGSSDITICDICPLTRYYYYLKLASLLSLNREEFLRFLCETNYGVEDNPNLLSRKTFNKIKYTLKELDEESYYLWEYLISNYNHFELNKLFRSDMNLRETIIRCNDYLKNDSNYKHTRKTLLNTEIKFIIGDITKEKYDRTFDNIWLSNVAHYLTGEGIINMFINTENALVDDGKMLLCYYWNTNMLINDNLIQEFYYLDPTEITIPGTTVYQDNGVLIYKKNKK